MSGAQVFVLVVGVCCWAPAARATNYALVIGNNRGAATRRPLRYAEADAKKVHGLLAQLGGFAPENMALHLGAGASAVLASLRRLEGQIARQKREGGGRSLFMLYFSGHADAKALELGASRLPYTELKRFLMVSQADLRVAVVDSCQSGQLVATKGGQIGSHFPIQLSEANASQGYVLITSSAANELSQESAAIRGSVFTHHFVSALRGAGDVSGDNKVTLAEAYRYAYLRTVAQTAADLGGGQHPMYDFRISGRGDIVLSAFASRRAGLHFTPERSGRLVVLSQDRDGVVGEYLLRKNQPLRVALAPATYWLYLIDHDEVRRAKVEVASEATVAVQAGVFDRYRPRRSIAKGGLFAPRPSHRLAAGLLLRRMPLEGGSASYGAGLRYGLLLGDRWEPLLGLAFARARDVGRSTGYWELGVFPALARRLWQGTAFTISAEARLGLELLLQADLAGESRYSFGFSYGAGVSASYDIGAGLSLQVDALAGGRGLRLRAQGWQQRLDLQLLSGVAWSWEG